MATSPPIFKSSGQRVVACVRTHSFVRAESSSSHSHSLSAASMNEVCLCHRLLVAVGFFFLPSFLLPRGNNTKKTILLSSHMHVAPFGGVFCCVRNGSGASRTNF
jgi:hypothetical protein